MSQGIITTSPAVSLPAGRDIINANFTELYTAVTSTRAANLVWCGPATGSAAAPTFRALVAADIPSLSYAPAVGSSSIVTVGTLTSGENGAGFTLNFGVGATNGVLGAVNGGTGIENDYTIQVLGGNLQFTLSGSTNLSVSSVGENFLALTNPGAITFTRINADNTVSALSDIDFRTAIGAGTSNFDGVYNSLTGKPDLSLLAPLASPTFTGTVNGAAAIFSGAMTLGDYALSLNGFYAGAAGNAVAFRRGGSAAVLELYSDNASTFRVCVGGIGASFPAIQRSGSDVEIVKGDGAHVDTAIICGSADGTRYRLSPPNGGGAATWVAA